MIEKEIFTVLQRDFGLNAILQTLKIFTFVPDEETKPFVVYQIEEMGHDSACFSLDIHSDYKGVSEVLTLQKEIRECLENQSHEQEGYHYVFKEQKASKNNILIFKAKRFVTGE